MRTIALVVVVLFPQLASAEIARQIARLEPSVPDGAGGFFGFSVALDGGTAVVGSPWHDNDGGQVFLFDSSTGAPTGFIGGGGIGPFGSYFAAGGGLLAVSELFLPFNTDPPPQRISSVSGFPIYESATGTLVERTLADGDNFDRVFGAGLAADGGQVLIGAPRADGFQEGAFYLYDAEPQSPGTLQFFGSPEPTTNSLFGYLVGMNERYLVAVEPVNSILRRYDRQTGAALPDIALSDTPPPTSLARLPSIDLDGDLILIGNQQGGAAQVYNLETGDLLQTLTLSNSSLSLTTSPFRNLVAIENGLALLSVDSIVNGLSQRQVLVFDVATGEELGELTPDGPTPRLYGSSIDLQDGVALVGGYDTLTPGSGAAYLFQLIPEPATSALVGFALLPVLCRGRRR